MNNVRSVLRGSACDSAMRWLAWVSRPKSLSSFRLRFYKKEIARLDSFLYMLSNMLFSTDRIFGCFETIVDLVRP